MIENLVGFISKALTPTNSTAIAPVKSATVNPFARSANPFMNSSSTGSDYYAKNKPVRGGYFAGYYNGKPNIVGRRLFVEV